MAVQQQVPIVPISLLNNHEIFPEKKKLRMYWRPIRAVVHPPIETKGLTQTDIERLKEETFRIIDESLMNQPVRVAVN
jgi:1-acyl-sn-glycerol-3-phosphate acyltransferase